MTLTQILEQIAPPSPEAITATGNLLRDLETVKLVIIAIVLVVGMMLLAAVWYLKQRDKEKSSDELHDEIGMLRVEMANLRYNVEQISDRLDRSHMQALRQMSVMLRLKPIIDEAINNEKS